MRNANKKSKNPLFRNGEENEKVIRNPHANPNHHRKLITSRGTAKFGRLPFPRSSMVNGNEQLYSPDIW